MDVEENDDDCFVNVLIIVTELQYIMSFIKAITQGVGTSTFCILTDSGNQYSSL
jgi:hypothetical protein